MVISDALKNTTEQIGDRRDAQILLCHILNTDIAGLIMNGSRPLSEEEEKELEKAISRRKNGEPIYYITGKCEFMSLEFEVNKNVLIPRSDTETLAELVIEEIGNKKLTVLDIGTGSGCIGISIAKYCPNTEVFCIDISEEALAVAKRNARRNEAEDRIKFIKADILNEIPNKKCDFLVSNPPYIRPEVIKTLEVQVKDFEPYGALYGGEDGLDFYRRIVEISPDLLHRDGCIAFEIGFDQGSDVKKITEEVFSDVTVKKDLCRNDRVVFGKGMKI